MKKAQNGKVIVVESQKAVAEVAIPVVEAAQVEVVAQKEPVEALPTLDIVKIDKMLSLPANLPYPKDLGAKINGLPEAKVYTVQEIIKAFADGEIVIPGFQRADVWDEARKKSLEFSVVNGYPVPPIMLVKNGDKLHLDDGQQRLRALIWAKERYDSILDEIDTVIQEGKLTENALANIQATKDKVGEKLEALLHANITALIWPEMSDDAEKYAYAALNNGKAHNGSEWGRTFIPAQGMDFVKNVSQMAQATFGKKSIDFALYLWAAMGGLVEKTPSGRKAFPVVRNLAETNEKFVFPEIPEGFGDFLAAIAKRPQKSNEDYNIGSFAKPGVLVPFVQGLKIFGSYDMSVATYVIANIDRLTLTKVQYIDKKAKGPKGKPTMVTKSFPSLLALSGSSEALTWKKAQGWAKIFRAAQKEMEDAPQEDDEIMSDLMQAVADMEADDND